MTDLKSADMKLLLLYKEWVLLKEFEKHDNALADKLAQKRMEKDEIDAKVREARLLRQTTALTTMLLDQGVSGKAQWEKGRN